MKGIVSGIHTKGVVDADSPRHALLTLDRREDFSGVLEGNGSFAERVGDREDVDEPAMVISTVDSRFQDVMITHKTTGPRRAPELAVSGIKVAKPAASKKIAMIGKVIRVKVRRPLVSIKNRVGMVKTTWTAP